jgi:hypothetical protein
MLDLLALYPTLTRTEATEQAHIDILTYLDHPSFTIKKIVRVGKRSTGMNTLNQV